MGEMSDYYLEQTIGDEFYENRSQPTATTWVTRDGQRIPVSDMTDVHLVNTIRYLRRTSQTALLRSVVATGMSDAAEMALGTEFDNLDNDECAETRVPTFRAMLAEAKKRGLKVEV